MHSDAFCVKCTHSSAVCVALRAMRLRLGALHGARALMIVWVMRSGCGMYRGMRRQKESTLTAHAYTTTTRKRSGQAASLRPTLHASRLLGRPTAHRTRTHTSASRPPARTRHRPSGRRAGGSSPAAPSRASRAPAARRRRPQTAAARAATLSPAPPHGTSTTRARGRGGGGRSPRRP